jgi:hypothetical protein
VSLIHLGYTELSNLLWTLDTHGGENTSAGAPTIKRYAVAPPLLPAVRRSGARELERIKGEADILRDRVEVLAHSERRLRKKLADRAESSKDLMTELQGTRTELIFAEEKIAAMDVQLQLVKGEFEKYRRWWLTEYYSLKVVLELVSSRDNVEEIASSSRARFLAHSGSSRS